MTGPVLIDGASQPGFAGSPLVELDGSAAGGDGLTVSAGTSEIRGLVINRFAGSGVVLTGGGGNVVAGNYIGTDAAGAADLGNGGDGVRIEGGSGGNTVGGALAGQRNVISGNGANGVLVAPGGGNYVYGNHIGTSASGSAAVGNASYGVRVFTSGNQIGAALARNVISGNGRGVSLEGAGATGNFVRGNYVGTNAGGNSALANNGTGVEISAPSNTVGGDVSGQGNVISGNAASGIALTAEADAAVIQGNKIGTNAAGTAAIPNASYGVSVDGAKTAQIGGETGHARNLISGNAGAGIIFGNAPDSFSNVHGNYVGTDTAGAAAIPNAGGGIHVSNSSWIGIGGAGARRNVISRCPLGGSSSAAPTPNRTRCRATTSARTRTATPAKLTPASTTSATTAATSASRRPSTTSSAGRIPARGT